ncbi:PAS domain-containing protein [Brevibacillus fluminis]|uniref:HTH-type transcriptional regulatory protein TyrR n=1 Tax=Brevibacillus fluminis TaxID=511487 RepID=A0A3M8CZB6_9BACL|nr:sigma 54-interacting transcriptional regulator [Brevibacillus fluminis]RNB80225.1 PAS domain-containing protein [Brevibacillus fluminis]
MQSDRKIIHDIQQINSIGIVITDQEHNIQFVNKKAEQYCTEKDRNDLLHVSKQGARHFCVLHLKCEIEVITILDAFLFFIQSTNVQHFWNGDLSHIFLFKDEIKQILDSSFDGVTICDDNGVFLFQNQADQEILEKNCIGKNVRDLVNEGVFNKSATLHVLETGESVSIIQKYENGKKVLVSATPIRDKEGTIRLVLNNTRDLNKLNRLEREIAELEEQNKKIKKELQELKVKTGTQNSIQAHDPKMLQVVERALRVAKVDSLVLIQGESGVGKEGIANLIHQHSNRKDQRLIVINCGAIPEKLLESELFGYEPGAFTGANPKGKAGLFEIASDGTIFLDEIAEMPLLLQAKLLRVLQEYQVTRIGGNKPIKVNVRVIAATNRDLFEMVNEGKFREDLYYRLHIIPIFIPPLRERKADIIPLVYFFLKEIQERYGISRTFSQEVLETFLQYDWPGNVRELKNKVERISLMINKNEILITDIENEMDEGGTGTGNGKTNFDTGAWQREKVSDTKDKDKDHVFQPLKEQIEEFERNIIMETLDQFSSIRKAAIALSIDQSALVRKMQKHQIKREIVYKKNNSPKSK